MARVLVFTNGWAISHVTRPFIVARELRRRGHTLRFAGGGRYLDIPEKDGFRISRIFEIDPKEYFGRVNRFDMGLPRPLAARYIDDELAVIRDFSPDIVLNDHRITSAASARLTSILHATIVNTSVTRHYAPRIRPLRGGRIRKKIVGPLLPTMRELLFRRIASSLNRELQHRGGSRLEHPLGGNDLTIFADTPGFAPVQRLDSTLFHAGPLTWSPDKDDVPWEDIEGMGKQLIYCTAGSTGRRDIGAFYREAADLFLPHGYSLLFSSGAQVPASELPPEKDVVYVRSFVNGDRAAAAASVVICHGGNGTIYQALRYGTPIIAVPENIDQAIHSQRLNELGAGIHLEKRRIRRNLKPVAAAVKRLFSYPSFNEKAGKLSKEITSMDSPSRAADRIEQLLSESGADFH